MKVIVAGLGGMGSAAAAHLAARGASVLGFDRYTPAHDRGSSHGRSRIIRQAYFESPAYVPLLLRAYELWRQLDRDTPASLLTITGGLMIGTPESDVFTGSLASAQMHGLDHEVLDAAEIKRRFPPMTPAPGTVGLYERMAGFLDPERSTLAHLQRAAACGAELRFEEPVLFWAATSSGVRVTTSRATYEAERLVLAPGPWAPELLADLGLPLRVERQVLYWFDPIGGIEPFHEDHFPIYVWELERGRQIYGFPAQDGPPGGVKVGFHFGGQPTTAETIDRSVSNGEVEQIRAAWVSRIPSLAGPLLHTTTCMYTTTPDHHFILGTHARHANVIVASPCSGHGYKFASVIGEILAELAIDGRTAHDIALFSPMRFGITP